MKIKVCGLREPQNIEEVLTTGVDYLGFIFYDKSSRYVGGTSLDEWLRANSERLGQVKKTGVFVNAGMDTILNAVHDYELDLVQLHGNESAGYCRELQLLWSVSTLRKAKLAKAFSIDADFKFSVTELYAGSCDLFIFDTGGQQAQGGTGLKWDWAKLSEYKGHTPFLLSGGIGPNDARSVQLVDHPQLIGLDLNSKFEDSPGLKNVDSLRGFLEQLSD